MLEPVQEFQVPARGTDRRSFSLSEAVVSNKPPRSRGGTGINANTGVSPERGQNPRKEPHAQVWKRHRRGG